MATMANGCFYPVLPSRSRPMEQKALLRRKPVGSLKPRRRHSKRNAIYCTISESGTVEENRPGAGQSGPKRKVEDYNTAMKRMMRNPYEYHHDLGMNYTIITDSLIVGSQPQKPEDIDHLKAEENVAYILCLQQDKDIEYWGIDFQSIVKRCKELGILHMRRPLNTAYNTFTSKRPCGPNKRAIRGATYDLAKNDPWKEPFESLPEYAFGGIADWERKLIQERVRGMRGA
ncbi:phosphoglucan phosphatase LSF2, chloroplastic isoform X2 [Elaeis guineensis]|uniref:Phosphoglucan phosphatase LSF2, chloroplastic isoform X2 n=1 Tax=Elaeis guineensis var. tenera TaxID=51953 RepID=A0A6I9RRN8_ELAGV|nr:phosphoglucan phosphatase LSF2, chloroplastic isoform X2 [Elaeis guineensis]